MYFKQIMLFWYDGFPCNIQDMKIRITNLWPRLPQTMGQ